MNHVGPWLQHQLLLTGTLPAGRGDIIELGSHGPSVKAQQNTNLQGEHRTTKRHASTVVSMKGPYAEPQGVDLSLLFSP